MSGQADPATPRCCRHNKLRFIQVLLKLRLRFQYLTNFHESLGLLRISWTSTNLMDFYEYYVFYESDKHFTNLLNFNYFLCIMLTVAMLLFLLVESAISSLLVVLSPGDEGNTCIPSLASLLYECLPMGT